MKSVKRKHKLVAVVLFEQEIRALEKGKRPDENVSEFIRKAIRYLTNERKDREDI